MDVRDVTRVGASYTRRFTSCFVPVAAGPGQLPRSRHRWGSPTLLRDSRIVRVHVRVHVQADALLGAQPF